LHNIFHPGAVTSLELTGQGKKLQQMNKRLNLIFIAITILAVFFTSACTEETAEVDRGAKEQRFFDIYTASRYPDVGPLASGLYFVENTVGTGASPAADDWVLINHVNSIIPDEHIYESYIENVSDDNNLDINKVAIYGPFKMLNGITNAGHSEGLGLMREGGEATMFFTSDLGFGPTGNGTIGAFQSLKYEVELLEVIPDMDAYELAKIASYMDTVAVYDTIHDPTTDAVLYYMIDYATDGAPVAIDSTIEVAYRGYLTDERQFDESAEDAPYKFKVGDYQAETSPIAGWHLGLAKFKNGEKGRLVIPYQFAYGEEGRTSGNLRTMPQYETLVFDVEIVSVESDDEDDTGPEQ
jgi:FKBP-type peptidyl-prolyl cis-trans isomerase